MVSQPLVLGKVPYRDFKNLKEKINLTWEIVQDIGNLNKNIEAPVIYMSRFSREKQSKEWNQWQQQWILDNPYIWLDWSKIKADIDAKDITSEWIAENAKDIFPFPKSFLAFHYDGTNRIQINPKRTFYAFYQNSPYGIHKDFVGYGYYSIAHEMLHYVLEAKGIKTTLHHCLFVRKKSSEDKMLIQKLA